MKVTGFGVFLLAASAWWWACCNVGPVHDLACAFAKNDFEEGKVGGCPPP